MITTIHQPEHLPWIGFFQKMSMAETYIILDNVQYRKGYYQNRNRIMGTNGSQWINVPVQSKGCLNTTLQDILIDDKTNRNWRKKYLNTIYCSYRKCPYFDKYYRYLEELMDKSYTNLCNLNIDIIMYFADVLDIHPNFIRASDLSAEGHKSDLILSLCKTVGADVYISGTSGRDYMKLDDYRDAGIKIVFQEMKHPVYIQHNNQGFEPYMSVLDLLFNVEQKDAQRIVKESGYCVDE